MFFVRKTVIAVGCLMMLIGAVYAQSSWLKGSTEEQLKTLGDLQPGLGTVMIEYGYRYTTAYYAAKAGNWGLAEYQLKEMREIQEVGETTRPARAGALKGFETAFLDPLGKAIEAKDFKKFQAAFSAATEGCNGCHVSQGFAFIKYELPKAAPSPLKP
jgi:hypothetical protein